MKKLWLMISVMAVGLAGYAGTIAEWSAASANAASDITFEATTVAECIDGVETMITLGETNSTTYYPLNSSGKYTYQLQNDTALNEDKYIRMVVKADEGCELKLTDIWMTVWRASNGATNLAVRWSIDDFTADLDSWTIDPSVSSRSRQPIALDMPVSTNQVEFRLYLWNGVGYGTTYLSDDAGKCVSIEGSVIIPVENAVVLAEWSDEGLVGGFASNPVWSNSSSTDGMDADATITKLDETKTNSTYYGNNSKMAYQLQNDTSMNLSKYAQVFVAPEDGQSLSLSGFSFNIWSADSGAQNVAVRSSVDNFESDLVSSALVRGLNNRIAVDLQTAPFAGLTSTVEFRIYLWNAAGYQMAYFTDGIGANSIAIEGALTSVADYAGWASVWGVDIGAETNDYDGDGILNIYEYGLGGNPTNAADRGASPVFAIDGDGAGLSYIYPRLAISTELNYYIELTDDLVPGSWTNAGYTVSGTNITSGTLDYVTNRIATDDPQKFIRLIIE